MSVRVRVAVALIVAAVVPLLGVFTIAGVLLPRSVNVVERARLSEATRAASALLVRDCAAVTDRASLVVGRLQVAVSVAELDVSLEQAVRDEAAAAVPELAGAQDPWSIVVLDADGAVLQAAGRDAGTVTTDLPGYLDRSCADGELGEPGALAVSAPVRVSGDLLGTVLVVTPLDVEALDQLVPAARGDRSVAVVADGRLLAGTSDLTDLSDPAAAADEQAQLPVMVVEAVDAAASSGESGESEVAAGSMLDRPYAIAPPVLAERVNVVVLGQVRTSVDRNLALAFVVTAFGAAVLVWLLSASLTRPLAELADLARRIASGEELPGSSSGSSADPDADVMGVSTVLGSLARDLRASEADAQRRRSEFLDAFSRLGDALQRSHDQDGLLQTVLQAGLLAAEAPMGLALHHDRSSRLPRRVVSLRARARGDGPEELDEATSALLARVAERALREGRVIEVDGTAELGPVLAVPLGSASRPLGAVVVARDPGAPSYDAVAFEVIGELASNAGTALGNIKEHQEVSRLSVTDPLTGVNNFRHLSTQLARELERANRFGHPLGVLMLDIDRFKLVNDTYGHPAGDAVLRELARRVTECVREVDTVARYGGEEFVLLLPETDLDGSARLGERVLTSLRSEVFHLPDGPDILVTASLGVAAFPIHGSTATHLIRAADDALYQAKTSGRDRVVVAEVAPQVQPAGAVGSPDADLAP